MKFEFDSSSLAEVQAIRAACDHLLRCASASDVQPVSLSHVLHVGEAVLPSAVSADEKAAAAALSPVDEIIPRVAAETKDALVDAFVPQETDSSGAEWNADLHASTKAKNQDGTWKKRRNAKTVEHLAEETGSPAEVVAERLSAPQPPATSNGEYDPAHVPTPPTPPTPPAAEVVTMNQIWALITNKTHTLDDVLKAAQAMGFADLGAVAQTATAEQRAQLYKELTA